MKHKYLNDIGISSDELCIFSTNEKDPKRMEKFKEQKRVYGFDERETWNLGYTLITWIYSHVKYMKEEAGKVIDWTWKETSETIPVLKEVYGPLPPESKYFYHIEVKEKHTMDEIWDIIIDYCEAYMLDDESSLGLFESNTEKAMCAIEILSVIFPGLGW